MRSIWSNDTKSFLKLYVPRKKQQENNEKIAITPIAQALSLIFIIIKELLWVLSIVNIILISIDRVGLESISIIIKMCLECLNIKSQNNFYLHLFRGVSRLLTLPTI